MWHELRLFLVALQFLTRVPLPGALGRHDDWLQASARHFPGVGLLVGGVSAGVLWAAAHAWPAMVAVLLALAATVWLTGAFHLLATLAALPLAHAWSRCGAVASAAWPTPATAWAARSAANLRSRP